MAGIAEAKRRGGRRVGIRISLTTEKEALIRQLHAQGKAVAAIVRMVSLSRKSVYKAWSRQGTWPEPTGFGHLTDGFNADRLTELNIPKLG